MAKVKYEPDYETAVWRIYFINKGNLTFKNYYITFEWIILELDDEKREIYNDITTLFNGIEDRSVWNTDLKRVLDKLRKSLNNRSEVTSLVITIKDLISNWGIEMDQKQKDLLDSIIWRLENEDTIVSVWMNEYERNRKEILALLPPDSAKAKYLSFDCEYGLVILTSSFKCSEESWLYMVNVFLLSTVTYLSNA